MTQRRVLGIALLLFGMTDCATPGVDQHHYLSWLLLTAYGLAEITSSLKLPSDWVHQAGIAVGPFKSSLVDMSTVADFKCSMSYCTNRT